MTLSLILATVGRTEELGRCLRSLSAQTDSDFEVIVVDQNQDDRLAPILTLAAATGLNLRHVRLDRPSLSGARNTGIKHARGTIVGFPDDDCWYEPDAVQVIRHAFIAHPEPSGVVACWVEQSDARATKVADGPLSISAWRNFRGGDASSITLFMRLDLIQRLKGFDEKLGVGCWYGAGEETDLLLRALASDARIVHQPLAKIHHAFTTKITEPLKKTCVSARKRARGTGAIYAKHSLSTWTIIRGLIAPIVVPLLAARWPEVVRGCFISMGRMEGYVRWKVENK